MPCRSSIEAKAIQSCDNIQNNCRNFADCGLHFEKESFLGDYGISYIYSRCIVGYGVDEPQRYFFFLFQIFFQFFFLKIIKIANNIMKK